MLLQAFPCHVLMKPKLVSRHHTTLQASFVVQTPLTRPHAAARGSRCGAIAAWPLDSGQAKALQPYAVETHRTTDIPLFTTITTRLDRNVACICSLTIMAVLQGVRMACPGSASIG